MVLTHRGLGPARVLMIGTGSIGRRHLGNVRALWPMARCAALRIGRAGPVTASAIVDETFDNWASALAWAPELAIVASPSDCHREPIEHLAAHGVAMLIEKPVVASAADAQFIDALLATAVLPATQVGCVLRFLPAVERLRGWLADGMCGRIAHARFEAGQYLPDWRRASDYRQNYSADAARGGGVILDLVHEIDLAVALFGELELLHVLADHRSALDLRCEDVALLTLRGQDGVPIQIALDYVSRSPVRAITVVGDEATAKLDFIARQVTLVGPDGPIEQSGEGFAIDDAYRAELIDLVEAAVMGRDALLPLREGMRATLIAIAAHGQARDQLARLAA